ncbi:MAG TPA: TolC family protein [Acidobacteriota bacterium]|nr:TolC family protein [Acidobacteriota bacterium]
MLRNVILIFLLTAQVVHAQTVAQSDTPQPVVRERIGVSSTKPYALTMQEAITLALENNRDIEVERIGVQRKEFDLAAAKGVYDPTMDLQFSYNRRDTPVASFLAGGENGKVESSDLSNTTTFTKRLPWQGGTFKATFENNRATTDNQFYALSTEFQTGLRFEFTQPLLRNRSTDSARRQIKISSKQLALSDIQFRQRVIEIISQVNSAYWDLVFSYRNEEIKRESVELAKTQLEQIQRLVDKGQMAPSEMISANVEIERRTDEAEAALEAVQRAENSLKSLILQPDRSDLWNTMLLPVDQPQIDQTLTLHLDEALKTAFQNRPELEQYRIKADLNKVDVDYFRNQTKPEVNLIASYGTNGLAGEQRTGDDPLTLANQPLFTRINQLSQLAGLPVITPTINNVAPTRFIGGYGDSLQNLFRNDFKSWQVGVNVSFSLGNHTAKAQLGQALAEGRQLSVEQQRTQQMIEIEVRNALQAVTTAQRRVEAANSSFTNAGLQYEAERRKFLAGLSTNYLVLDRQNALSAAQGRKLKALTDYNKATADLRRALSTTLSSGNIMVSAR